eukprot:scaffold208562_cov36-Attheya_sp.AAC.1
MVLMAGRPAHPLVGNDLLKQSDDASMDNLQLQCVAYLTELQGLHCFNTKKGLMGCNCLSTIGSLDQMAGFMIHHLKLTKQIQNIRIIEWLRSEKALKESRKRDDGKKKNNLRRTFFQCGVEDTNGQPLFLCRNAVMEIFNIGFYRLSTLTKYMNLPELPKHGLCGKQAVWMKSEKRKSCENALNTFFEELSSQAETHATRVVRERTKATLRDCNVDLVELPSSMTKRNLYEQFCYGRGYKMQVTATGSYGPLNEANVREVDPEDDSWPEGSVPLPICSYGYFWSYWKRNFPNLAIRPPSRDTCDECFGYSNALGVHTRSQQLENSLPLKMMMRMTTI